MLKECKILSFLPNLSLLTDLLGNDLKIHVSELGLQQICDKVWFSMDSRMINHTKLPEWQKYS